MLGSRSSHYRYDVFLSHSSADKPLVRQLAEQLRAAGLRVWFDEWQIKPGDLISTKIEEGLEHAAVLLFCMSTNAFGSDWVQLESHTAIFRDPLNRDRRFVPLRLDDAPIKAMLRGFAYIDWRLEADRLVEWGRLLEACGVEDAVRAQVATVAEPPSDSISLRQPRQVASTAEVFPREFPAVSASASQTTPMHETSRILDLFHPGTVTTVCWSPNGCCVASSGRDGTVRLWDARRRTEVAVLEGHKSWVRSVCWSPDGECVLSGGEDGTVRLWDVGSGTELAVLEGHKGGVSSVCWSSDGERVVSGGEDGTVRLWNARTSTEMAVLGGHRGWVCSVSWSPDGKSVVSGGDDATVRLWDAGSGAEVAVLEGHKSAVSTVSWSPDSEHVVSGGDDGTVRLWEPRSGMEVAALKGHKGDVCTVCWSPDGERIASGGDDGTVRLWDARSRTEVAVLEGHRHWVWSVSWSPDGQSVVSGGEDGTVRLWETGSYAEVALLEGHKGWVRSVGWSPDGERIASGGDDGSVRLWNVGRRRDVVVLGGHSASVWSVTWSPDGDRVASGGRDGTVRLWDAGRATEVAVLTGHRGWVWSVTWSPDGDRVASGGRDGTVRLWDVGSGRAVAVFEGHKSWVLSVCWSPDGDRVVSCGRDGTVRLWDVRTGTEMAVLGGHRGWVWSVSWSPDNDSVVSGGEDGTVRLWDVKTRAEMAVLEGHIGWVRSVSLSTDGEHVLSGGDDGTVRLWDAGSGTELVVLDVHKSGVTSVGWSPHGGAWASGAFGLLLLWPPISKSPLQLPGIKQTSRTYTSAKVLVVGESGAGKTGLTRRLATGSFEDSEASTVGAWCTHWPLPLATAPDASAGEPQREIWLWDFGGQADQRLIHQLFLDRAALVLLLFNAENDQVIDGLRDWQIAIRRSLAVPPPQLLVAARIDAGFGASRAKLQRHADETNCRFLETSARTGDGCPELTAAIAASIAWEQLPRHTSPLLFQQLKAAILRLRDEGETLLTYKELRERLLSTFPSLDDATLRTVLGLLDSPGVLKQLDYGDLVLLKPEWLGVYGQAVVRALKQAEPQLGALPVGAICTADLPFAPDQSRLDRAEEPLLLVELERQLQDRKICLRQGGRLVFPSFCGLERPASPALPPRFMSYAVRGWLDEIHASLVVSLEETRVFHLQNLWRDAAEFRTLASDQALAVQLQRDNASEGTITVHTAAGLSLTEQAQFSLLIHGHLRDSADSVQRRRHWLCPHCHAPKGNEAVLMNKLERDGAQAQVTCDACDLRFSLFDDLERLLVDPEVLRHADSLATETPQLTSRRKGKLLMLEVGARLTSANQKWQEVSPDEDDGIDLQLEFTDDDGNGTGRYLYLQLKAGPSHLHRRADGREMFRIQKPRWVRTWTQQPGPVMLVIGREVEGMGLDGYDCWPPGYGLSNQQRALFRDHFQGIAPASTRAFPDVRWMEISSVLKQQLETGRSAEQIKQIQFVGETLDMASVLRWRRRILEG